jgi:hypothetical protein
LHPSSADVLLLSRLLHPKSEKLVPHISASDYKQGKKNQVFIFSNSNIYNNMNNNNIVARQRKQENPGFT